MDKIAKKAKKKLMEIGPVAALDIKRKRQRDPDDMLSAGKRSTQRKAAVGFETKNDRDKADLNVRGETNRGRLGGGATRAIVKRRLGIVAGTEMDWKHTLVELKVLKSPATKQKDADDAAAEKKSDIAASRLAKSGDTEKREAHHRTLLASLRQKEKTQGATASIAARYGRNKPHPLKKGSIAASTELDWTNKLVEHLIVEKNWIKGAVNPAHKGFCSPMTKSTCTPRRKALAKRFKKAGRKEKKTGGTGWEGKV
tara:strand:- start:212 stop:976 length:765 start_codon:yes stop_codon:yes gene_type:complete